jgi:drug/metabolite transporter (DMT)-like permease
MDIFFFLLVVLAIFFYEWFRRFITLMLLPDDCFPGRYDKLIWGLAFIVLFFVTPITFYFWQKAYLQVKSNETDAARQTA